MRSTTVMIILGCLLLVQGCISKEIASQLNISATTVDFQRRDLWEKLKVESAVELGRLYESYTANP